MLPIVERIEDAPEVGDAVLQVEDQFVAVRDREAVFFCTSIHGWQTKTCYDFEESAAIAAIRLKPGQTSAQGFVFAPDAATAIERYHASQACSFGKVTLQHDKGEPYRFVGSYGPNGGVNLLRFNLACVMSAMLIGLGLSPAEAQGFHALLSEVIAYQKAERTGAKDSRIHKAIKEMGNPDGN